MAAPSLLSMLSPFTDAYASFGYGKNGKSAYPFSVKPDKPLKVEDVMAMMRDQYAGTRFDLSVGTGTTLLLPLKQLLMVLVT
jgi:dipeptidase